MRVSVVRLAGVAPVPLAGTERVPCEGAVFRDDYAQCTNKAIRLRGRWHLCAPHARKDELEVVMHEDSAPH